MSKDFEQFRGAVDQNVVDGFTPDLSHIPNRNYGNENPNKRGFSPTQGTSMRSERTRHIREIVEHVDGPVRIGKVNRFR